MLPDSYKILKHIDFCGTISKAELFIHFYNQNIDDHYIRLIINSLLADSYIKSVTTFYCQEQTPGYSITVLGKQALFAYDKELSEDKSLKITKYAAIISAVSSVIVVIPMIINFFRKLFL